MANSISSMLGCYFSSSPAISCTEKQALANVQTLSKALGYTFKNPKLMIQALTRRSAIEEKIIEGQDFQRLEFLGDRVLNLVISEIVYHVCPTFGEGKMTQKASELTNNKGPLRDIALRLKLDQYLIVGKGEEINNVRNNCKVLSDIVEAMIGAIWIDCGHDYEVIWYIIYDLFKF